MKTSTSGPAVFADPATAGDRFGLRSTCSFSDLSSAGVNNRRVIIGSTALPFSYAATDVNIKTWTKADELTSREREREREGKRQSIPVSDSKLRKRRRTFVGREDDSSRKTRSVFDRVFKVVFFVCLLIFLHALSGVGANVDVDIAHAHHQQELGEYGSDAKVSTSTSSLSMASEQVRLARLSRFHRRVMMMEHDHDHDHLALDPDGHYTYTTTAVFANKNWSRGRKATNHTRVAQVVPGGTRVANDMEDVLGAARAPTFNEDVKTGIKGDATHTPQPATSFAASHTLVGNQLKTPILESARIQITRIEDVDDLDFSLFGADADSDGPVYPLRYLPGSRPVGVPGERERKHRGWGRKHGRVVVL